MNDPTATRTKLFQQAADAFVLLTAIQHDVERVFKSMQSVKPESDTYKGLNREFTELNVELSHAHQAFSTAQRNFLVFVRGVTRKLSAV